MSYQEAYASYHSTSLDAQTSRASPIESGASAIVGTIATSIGGAAFGRFARGLLGGLLR